MMALMGLLFASALAAAGGPPEDRVVTGGDARVEAGEVVADLVVTGGSAEVLGTVTGDLVVMGGSARVHDAARVGGDAVVLGGSLSLDDDSTVAGDVSVVGGRLERSASAEVGGAAVGLGGALAGGSSGATSGFGKLLRHLWGAVTSAVLLFLFGVILTALAPQRAEALRVEVAARPWRSFALGVVGSLAAVVLLIALCVTVIGIPIALAAALLAVLLVYAGMCSVLAAIGGALVNHRSSSPYAHLAVGCALFFLVGLIPYVGGFATALVALAGIGALIATRLAGLVPKRSNRGMGPYRTAPETS